MHYARGIFAAACIALAGAGGGVLALTYNKSSPRLLIAAIVAIIIGIGLGGYAIGAALRPQRLQPEE
jgi:hypothetical protein